MTERRPLPRVEVELGRTVPGWVLRAAAALLTGGTLLVAAVASPVASGFLATFGVVAGVLSVWVAWRPGHRPALITAGCVALLLALTTADGARTAALWLAPLVYLAVRLSAWASATGPTARVEVAALARSARLDAVVIGVTLLIGAVALVLDGSSFSGLAVGAAAVLTLAVLVLRTETDR